MPLTAAQLEAMARAPHSATTDAGSATARSADDIEKLLALAAGATLDDGTNSNGGKKSAWRQTKPARHIPPGTT